MKSPEEINRITERIIGAAIAVHRALGPGLHERHYQEAMSIEFEEQGISYVSPFTVPMLYKSRKIGEYRIDFLVEDEVVVELKSIPLGQPAFDAQILTYLRVASRKVGLLINFNTLAVKNGISRFIL